MSCTSAEVQWKTYCFQIDSCYDGVKPLPGVQLVFRSSLEVFRTALQLNERLEEAT